MRQDRAALVFGAWLALASPAVAATPSDHELEVAYCLGLHVTFWTDVVERDMKEDCAPDAPSMLKAYCEKDKRTMAEGPQIVNRLRDYLATKQLSLADSSITLAAKRGAADYWQTIGADHACLRGPEAACRPAADNALTRVNRCSAIINALPF